MIQIKRKQKVLQEQNLSILADDLTNDAEVIGNIIKAKLVKGRMTKEESIVEMMLDYEKGLDKYYGLVSIAEKYGIFKKVSTRFETPSGKAFEKTIVNNPEKYFTKDVMEQLEKAVFKEFNYGSKK